MMAATGGQLEFCKTFWFALQEENRDELETIRKVLEATNDSGDSCLSLACCHGHVEFVDFLLDCCLISFDTEQVDKCRASLKRMEVAFKRNPTLLEQYQSQLSSVQKCVDKLEEKLAQRAEETARELLEMEPPGAKVKEKRGKKKKQKGKKQSISTSLKADKAPSKAITEEGDESVRLTTLSDGKIAVRVQGTNDANRPILVPTIRQPSPPSTDEMFRQRLEGRVSTEVDAVMDALCLDVSMLLYTPHGMALNLSPSQLDTVQGILEKQLEAVTEARSIQDRVHETSHSVSSS
jgi:hypothetical protein